MTKKVEKAGKSAQATKATKATKSNPVSVELSAEAVEAFHAFTSAKKAEANAKEAKEQAELILREALGSATEATISGMVVIKVQNGKNTHFDRKLMEEAFPEAYKATLRETLFTWLKTL